MIDVKGTPGIAVLSLDSARAQESCQYFFSSIYGPLLSRNNAALNGQN
jgi:hypothetical protein